MRPFWKKLWLHDADGPGANVLQNRKNELKTKIIYKIKPPGGQDDKHERDISLIYPILPESTIFRWSKRWIDLLGIKVWEYEYPPWCCCCLSGCPPFMLTVLNARQEPHLYTHYSI